MLVIGCETGISLLPYALAYPNAQVVGLDSNPQNIEAATASAKALRLENITLHLAEPGETLPACLETFDYIIVSGVYSYLPAEAANALMERCGRALSAMGLLYIDHHVYPGAKTLEVMRDAMLLHTHAAHTDEEVKTGAQAALTLFTEGLAAENPLAQALSANAACFQRGLASSSAFRTFACSPVYFVEFANKAVEAGLSYVGDAMPLSEVPLEFGQKVSLSHSLLALGQTKAVRQQYLDFATGRSFRQSLLVSETRAQEIRSAPDLERLADLRWASGLIRLSTDGKDDIASYVTNTGRGLSTTDKSMIALLGMLAHAWPGTVSYQALLGTLAREPESSKDDVELRRALDSRLKSLLQAELAHYSLGCGPYDRPENEPFRPLPNLTAPGLSAPLFNLWHETLNLVFNEQQLDILRQLTDEQSLQRIADETDTSCPSTYTVTAVLSLIKRYALHQGSAQSWRKLLEDGLTASQGRGHYTGLYISARARLDLDAHSPSDGAPFVLSPAILKQAQRLNQTMLRQSYGEAEAQARALVKLAPRFFDAWEALAIALCNMHRPEEGLPPTLRMLDIAPLNAQGYIVLATCLAQLQRTSEAITAGRRAVELASDNPHAHSALADALNAERRYNEAKTACLNALALDAGHEKARTNLAKILIDSGDVQNAIVAARDAVARAPKSLTASTNLLFVMNYAPTATAEEVVEVYQDYEQNHCAPLRSSWRPHKNSRDLRRKLRIAYVSPDFRQHSGNHFIEPLLAHHDRTAFEVTAYAELVAEEDTTKRFKNYFDRWVPTAVMNDQQLADRIRADGIDILIDLAGHTAGNRLAVFARKPAPVSLTWLGFGCTTGVSAIDYIMSDRAMAPEGSESLFAEKPWRLADTNFVYRPGPGMGDAGPAPALANGYVTLGTLTRAIRMNDRVVGVWSEILRRLPQAKLIVDSNSYRDKSMRDALQARFATQGIQPDRLLIGCHSPPWDLLRSMDIGLDCFPHNSGVTLVETLYMGVPYVTLADRPSVGRIGSSVLQGIGHPEWIAQTELEYVEKVVALANDLPALARIRAGLRDDMRASPLMDEAGHARKFESALREMFKQWCENQP
ncbi:MULTISPECIES: methyltransferase regulatory domain-containing protein [Achromobacter]|uniref:O-linked N-acetylglucosamine transferase family protein n=1 Tax=Achromobacter TaxID=222 RepID=UPI0020C6E377|nr:MULTISPECIES: methyltransferase regulatory domain-containing protein [Achromobacter]